MKYLLAITLLCIVLLTCWGQAGSGIDAQGDVLPTGAIARLGTQRYRHDSAIICQAVSNDGRLIATGGGRSVRVWEAATGKQLYVLTLNQSGRAVTPSAVAFSPDGHMLAALGLYGQGALTVWDLRGGQSRQELLLPQRDEYANTAMDVPFLAFAANTKHVLVKNYSDRNVRQFDLDTGMEMRTFQDSSSPLTTVAISPDGHWLAAGTEGRNVLLWDTKTGKSSRQFQLDYPLVSLAFSPDGQQLAAMDQDLAPRIWNINTGQVLHTLPARTRSVSLAWSANGQSLHVARVPDQILTWDLKTQQEKISTVLRNWVTGPIYCTAVPNQSDAIILGSAGRRGNGNGVNVARIRRIELGKPIDTQKFEGYENGDVFAFYLVQQKQWATIGTKGDDVLRLWSSEGRVVKSYTLPIGEASLRAFAADATGKWIALSALDGRTFIIDAANGQLQRTITAFNRSCYDVEFTANGEAIVLTDVRHVKVIELSTGKELKSYELNNADPMRTIISHDGSRIASMLYSPEDDQVSLRIIDARTGKVLSNEAKLAVAQQNYYLSPDGRNILLLASRGRTNGITVMETATGKTRFQAEVPSPYLFLANHARISPDGRWLVTAAFGNDVEQYAIVLWRLGGKADPIILQGHRGQVSYVHFSADSKQLLTVSADSSILVWDLQRNTPLPAAPLEEKGYAQLWQDMADQDTAKAFQAVHRLAQQPQAAAWLGKQIEDKAVVLKPNQIKEWIKQLDATKFADREEASKQLIKHAVLARPAIKIAIEQTTSVEAKRRLEQIMVALKENTGLSDNPLQTSRALETLEIMGTAESLKQLTQLAQRNDSIGQEAKDASQRLKNRIK